MSRLLLLRHGQSEWNAAGRWQGQADIPLSARGEEQAAEAAERLAGRGGSRFTVVVASDLQRTVRTAEIMAARLGIASIERDAGLREFDVGEWSGLTRPEIEQRWPGQLDEWREGRLTQIPGGESREHFIGRIVDAVSAIARRYAGQEVLVISHGGVIGTLQGLTGTDEPGPRITNLAGRWFSLAADRLVAGPVEFLLDAEESTVSPTA
jgi:broad specificity phosphatase PhoE